MISFSKVNTAVGFAAAVAGILPLWSLVKPYMGSSASHDVEKCNCSEPTLVAEVLYGAAHANDTHVVSNIMYKATNNAVWASRIYYNITEPEVVGADVSLGLEDL